MEETEKYFFDHEKLHVYQKAIEFVKWTDSLLKKIETKSSTKDQLERACESIVLNISEGNGKFYQKIDADFLIFPGVQQWKVRVVWMFYLREI